MKQIPLSRGTFALVDDEDFIFLSQWKWNCNGQGYASRYNPNGKHRGSAIFMHRVILGSDEGTIVDHINGDPLDNRRCNLRVCTTAQNSYNRKVRKDSKTGVKGITRHGNKWRAKISINKKRTIIGDFKNIDEASKAYNDAALKYYGDFARLSVVK